MITNKTFVAEQWMTKLWKQADKFDIPNDILPRNPDDLVALIEFNLKCFFVFIDRIVVVNTDREVFGFDGSCRVMM